MMQIVSLIFWLLLACFFFGLGIPYLELILGVLALIIAVKQV